MPSQTVDRPPRWPLVLEPENRDDATNKDARLVNGYMERNKRTGEYHIYKRPGLTSSVAKSGAGLGSYNWQGDVYYIFGTTVYKNGSSIGTVSASGGVYRFSSTLGGTPRLVLGNGVTAYTYDGSTFAQITDVDFPAAFVKGWAFLDGTTYVATSDAAIYGSEINDPTAWTSDNVIIAQIEPDFGVALSKQLVYTVILKQWTGEVFYDAANETGSPLSPVQGAKFPYGCVHADGVQTLGDTLIWPSIDREGSVSVVMLTNLKAAVISTQPVERLLTGSDFTGCFSWFNRINGHRFYALTLPAEDLTLVYDLTERMWAQWADTDGHYFPIVSSTFDSSNRPLLQHETDGHMYLMDISYVNDGGSLYSVDLYTPNFDAGVRSRIKQLGAMYFVGDRVVGSQLQIRTNDWDYATNKWTNFRTMDLSLEKPFLDNCGAFYKRALHMRHRANTKFRMEALELQFDIGSA